VVVDIDCAPKQVATAYLTSKAKKILDAGSMRVQYDSETDSLTILFRNDAIVDESDEEKPGIILDYDAEGNLVALEILDASRRVTDARNVEFQLAA
jgi:uncharacterized protein YuzE